MSEVTIGADPEIFLKANNNAIVPCVGILPGTKEQPAPLQVHPEVMSKIYGPLTDRARKYLMRDEVTENFRVQEDNVMAEFNIPPVADYHSFDAAITLGLGGVKKMALDKGYTLSKKATHTFTKDQLSSPQAQLIGCEPDYDAYNGGTIRNNPPAPGLERSCGGHIHVGGEFNCPEFVACLFIEAGLVSADRSLNDDYSSWYRRPGSYRPKPYGIEYRTPSNKWIFNHHNRIHVGDAVLRIARYLTRCEASKLQQQFRLIDWAAFRAALLANDTKSAQQMIYSARDEGYEI